MYYLSKPVFLIGFMGAGKTSIARRFARNYGLASIDLDVYVIRQVGKDIKEIFEDDGEEAFRQIEMQALKDIVEMNDNLLISCGGGIVTKQENLEIMEKHGIVVHLKVTVDQAAERISNTSSRPLFDNIDNARARCEERLPLYEKAADITIDTGGKSMGKIANELKCALEEKGILCQL